MQTFDIDGYKVTTGADSLVQAFKAVLPVVRSLVDVPPDLDHVTPELWAVTQGQALDFTLLGRDAEIQMMFALWNLVRLLCEDSTRDPEQRKNELSNIFKAMVPASSDVLFAALRNSLSREAENRPSQSTHYDGMELVRRHNLVQYEEFMAIIYKIRNEQLS